VRVCDRSSRSAHRCSGASENYDGLVRSLRLDEAGRYHWHWDPAFMADDRRPRSSMNIDIFTRPARLRAWTYA
jgi:hypothetical protein